MTKIEAAAIALHDFLWERLGEPNDEWPLQLSGDDESLSEAIRLLNELQEAIKASGYAPRDYSPHWRLP